ncbi:MAG: DNA cytosine methyltransferase [Steroidobacteraceae bacterium]
MKNFNKIIDLFSGVGGLSLGAARADFTVQCAVELDAKASKFHAINFPGSVHIEEDVAQLSGKELLHRAGIDAKSLAGLIGGPPCQGFSEIGHRSAVDPRNTLVLEFFRLVAETKPAFFLAENVPGILDKRNSEILGSALSRIPDNYEVLDPILVKASDYGAPTRRTRVFFYGYDPERVNTLTVADFAPNRKADVRVKRALAELPKLRSTWLAEEQSWRAVGSLGKSAYARSITDNVPTGIGNAEALELYKRKRVASGFLGTQHEAATVKRFDALKHGERDRISKGMRLDPEGYCPTLLAGTGPERGSYQAIRPIHPTSPRVICPREAARLQGFPDWFQFHPTKWHAFRQLGNSVSPIVAESLLGKIRAAIA